MRKTLLAVVALVIASCGDSTVATTTLVPDPAFPVTVRDVVIETKPLRIVSLSAAHTEVLFAIGAGDEVAATDSFSDYPEEADATAKIDAFNLSIETIASVDPGLVILAFDPGDVVDGLAALGISAILFDAPRDIEGAFSQWLELGEATGHPVEAQALVDDARRRVTEIADRVPAAETSPTYFHELDSLLYTVTSDTFVGSVYAVAGMTNIADPADETGFGYPQLSAEYILDANPDFVFLADTKCCGESAETFGSRSGNETLSAVQSNRVVALDDDVASRWGPRLVEFLETVVAVVYPEVFGG